MKIGIYLCTCEGEIEKVIDIDSLVKEASGWSGITDVYKDAFLCSEDGIRKIRKDVERSGFERVLIAACSPFFKMEEFSDLGLNKYLVERVNIREQCSRVHRNDPENATKKTKAMLRIFLEKAKYSQPLQPIQLPSLRTALVIGGGVAGINASIDIAGTDNEVFLIEKNPFLGGKIAGFHKYFPRMCPPSCGLELMFSKIKSNPNVHVLTSSEIDTISGSPGNFEISIKTSPRHIDMDKCVLCGKCLEVCPQNAIVYPEGFSYPGIPAINKGLCAVDCNKCVAVCPVDAIDLDEEGKATNIKVGAIVLATGWEPFDPTPLTEFGYGRLENVITNIEFEKIAKNEKHFLRSRKKWPLSSVWAAGMNGIFPTALMYAAW